MRSLIAAAFFPLAVLAAVNGPCTGAPDGTATSYYLLEGICLYTSDCKDSSGAAGSYISGGCPFDADDVKCCLVGLEGSGSVNPCGGESWCGWNTAASASICTSDFDGKFESGYCPGPSDYECCLEYAG